VFASTGSDQCHTHRRIGGQVEGSTEFSLGQHLQPKVARPLRQMRQVVLGPPRRGFLVHGPNHACGFLRSGALCPGWRGGSRLRRMRFHPRDAEITVEPVRSRHIEVQRGTPRLSRLPAGYPRPARRRAGRFRRSDLTGARPAHLAAGCRRGGPPREESQSNLAQPSGIPHDS
jgi:hypothetical protein